MTILLSGSYTTGATFTQANSLDEITLLDIKQIITDNLDLDELNTFYNWGFKFQIESLRATYWLGSTLNKIDYAEIYPEDSQSTRIRKLSEQENSQRIGLIAIRRRGTDDQYLACQLFQNIGREQQKELLDPYLARGNVKLLTYQKNIDQGDKLIYKLKDFGDGLIASYGDYIQIECDCTYYVSGYGKEQINITSSSFGSEITSVPKLLLPANNRRIKLTIANTGNSLISFHYGDQSGLIIGQCLELAPGSTWSDEGFYIDKGAIWAVSHSGNTQIVGKESQRV